MGNTIDNPSAQGFASTSVTRHLARGAVGFGAITGAFVLIPMVGPVSLLLAPMGMVALRGCPSCWTIGLIQTISAGRLERRCMDGRCELHVADRGKPADRPGVAGMPMPTGLPIADDLRRAAEVPKRATEPSLTS